MDPRLGRTREGLGDNLALRALTEPKKRHVTLFASTLSSAFRIFQRGTVMPRPDRHPR